MAKMCLIGRLAGPPDLIPTAMGTDIIKYTIATSHKYNDEQKTSFWRVVYFPKAESGFKDYVLTLGKG